MDQLQKAQFLEILEKYHAGNASKEEVEFLDAYYKAFGLRNGYTDYLTEEDRLLLKNELKNSISKKISTYQRSEIKTNNRNIFQWSISVAAAIIIIAAAGLFFYSPNKNAEQPAKLTIKKDIAPGGNKAILTLSNGKKISLTDASNGELGSPKLPMDN